MLGTSMIRADEAVIEIFSAEELAMIGVDPAYPDNGQYVLMQDIDLTGFGNWQPISHSNYDGFTGHFNGNGNTIHGLTIQVGVEYNQGLFSKIGKGGFVENLNLEAVSISTDGSAAGGLAGWNDGTITGIQVTGGSVTARSEVGGLIGRNIGTISNAMTAVSVEALNDSSWAGGLVGIDYGGVRSSSASGSVTGVRTVGGLIGQSSGNLQDVSASGDVQGESGIGGLIGYFEGTGNQLINGEATGKVSGTSGIGGLIGSASPGVAMVSGSMASGDVIAGDYYAGGLIGSNGAPISNSHAGGNVSGTLFAGGLAGRNTGNIADSSASGNVSGSDYVGGLVGDNEGFLSGVHATGTVTASGSTSGYIGGLIGQNNNDVTDSYAEGDVIADGSSVGGLIGYQYQKSVRNSYALGQVQGMSSAGGLIGNANYATLSNSYAAGSVLGTDKAGGLLGSGMTTVIEHSSASGMVEGTDRVGGLAGGMTFGSKIINSYAAGSVTGQERVGGLIGEGEEYSGQTIQIMNGTAFGDVQGATRVGGLAGFCSCSIDQSYAMGEITGISGSGIGGLVGYLQYGYLKNSYASGNITGSDAITVGGLVGYANNSVEFSYATGNIRGSFTTYGGFAGSVKSGSTLKNAYYSGDATGGNTLGTYRTAEQIKQKDQLSGFSFVSSGSLTKPWLIVPGETAPFPRNEYAAQPVIQMNTSSSTTLTLGENLNFSGVVALESETNPYVDSRMKPLYAYYTILDQNGRAMVTHSMMNITNPGETEAFGESVTIDSRFPVNQNYTLEIWAMTKKGGVAVHSQPFQVIVPVEMTLHGELADGTVYMENEWTQEAVYIRADFLNDVADKRQYSITDASIVDPASITDWINYAEPIAIRSSGAYKVWVRTENGIGMDSHQSFQIGIDTDAPATPVLHAAGPINSEAWSNGPVTLTISEGADALSGPDYSEYKLGADGTWTRYAGGIEWGTEGITEIKARTVDKAGNIGPEAELELKLDLTGPSEPTIQVAGAANGTGSWANNSVSVEITEGVDMLSGVNYTEYKLGTNGVWTQYIDSLTLSNEGITEVYARTVDRAGNLGAEAKGEVKLDLSDPAAPTIQVEGAPASGSWTRGPAAVTIIEGADTLSGPDYTEYKLGAHGAWTSYTSDFVLGDEGITEVYARTVDKAGNIGPAAEFEAKVDMTVPSEPIIQMGGPFVDGWATGPITVTISDGADMQSGVDYTEYKIGASGAWSKYTAGFTINTEGVTEIYARTMDKVGHAGLEAKAAANVDITGPAAPTIQVSGATGAENWADGPITIRITDGTDDQSGAGYSEYKIGSSGAWTTYTSEFTVNDEGVTMIYTRTVDKAGNIGMEAEYEAKIDTTGPAEPAIQVTGSLNTNGWSGTPVSVKIVEGADVLSGSDHTEFKVGASGAWTAYTSEFTVSDEGVTMIYARTVDKAGNAGTEAEQEAKVDTTGPSEPEIQLKGTISPNGWSGRPVTVAILEGNDAHSGADYTEYKLGANGAWTPYTAEFVLNDEGITKIYARTVDRAGNVGAETEREGKLDLTGPLAPIIQTAGTAGIEDWWTEPVAVLISEGADTYSGADYTEYKLGASGAWTTYTGDLTLNIEGITKIYARTVDMAGNAGAEADLEIKLDMTGPSEPVIDLTGPGAPNGNDSWDVGPITVSIDDGLDDWSGTDYTEYKINDGQWTKVTTSFTVGDAYETMVYARSIDLVGNLGKEHSRKVTITSKRPQPPSGGGGGGTSAPAPTTTQAPPAQGQATLPAGEAGYLERNRTIYVSIPKGATNRELLITLEPSRENPALPEELKAKRITGVYELSGGLAGRLLREITVAFEVDASLLESNEKAEIFLYSEEEQIWISLGGELTGSRLTAQTDQFGLFAVFAVDTGRNKAEERPVQSLSDLQGHWAAESIRTALEMGIVKGYTDGTFKPNHQVSRAEFIVMLVNALKLNEATGGLHFTDASKIGQWAVSAIAQALASGIVNGYEDGSFRPDKPITRAEMASMLANALGLRGEGAAVTGFADDSSIPGWVKDAAEALRSLGIVSGRSDNKFAPDSLASRAEAITVILRMLEHRN
ncbi:OmpL47-type beta-barrel domain-containing protein [Paenibacillus brevis]|uniref:S-layer homology domain-containing protein n=1 Tax=Paenibacillus brevis TaxID=2841508 RepID=A0ABS6FMZ9_9BACL|nr:S-layer homology domain-containing protein [Paenibacillus brevis]MBU5671336.1 S-layer homology domain-containing protein [Paenibacillus brevis]